MKYGWLIWLTITLYAFVPVSICSFWKSTSDNDLVISSKSCGCPCPTAKVENGQLNIPEIFLNQYPNIYKKQLNLKGNTPYKPFNYEIWLAKIKIKGKVVSIDTETICEFAPKFNVDNWTLVSYVARF